MKKNILDLQLEQLKEDFKGIGIPSFKADQIFEWIYKKKVFSFDQMTNISKVHIERISNEYSIDIPVVAEKLQSGDGTVKYLLKLSDNNLIECVLMEYSYGYSICISSQAGCRMGCIFCASTGLGMIRNLTPGEMTGQILAASEESKKDISRIVVMGIGEPFDNYDNLVSFFQITLSVKGLNIGARKITVSTCGIVPKIMEFANLDTQINLSISLHETDNEKRSRLMPINRKYPLKNLLDACRYYVSKTNRRISFEYALIPGENDQDKNAYDLAGALSDILCYVNIIPVNKTDNMSNISESKQEKISRFCDILRKQGLHVTVRRELGKDIEAACGQLRRRRIL